MGHKWDIWGYSSVQKCPRGAFKPQTRIIVQNVEDVWSFVYIKGHACKIVQNRSLLADRKRQFVAIDIFSGKRIEATFPESGPCFVPIITLSDYQLVAISEKDSEVVLLDEKGNMRVDLKLPTDQDLRSQIKFDFANGKDSIFVSVASAVGKEQIIASSRRSLLQVEDHCFEDAGEPRVT